MTYEEKIKEAAIRYVDDVTTKDEIDANEMQALMLIYQSFIFGSNEEVKEEEPKKKTRKSRKKKDAINPEITKTASEVMAEEAAQEEIEEAPVVDSEAEPTEAPTEEPAADPVSILGGSEDRDFQDDIPLEKEHPTEEVALEFNEKQLDYYVSPYKRDDKSTPEIAKALSKEITTIKHFLQESEANKELLATYLAEITEEDDKDKVSLRNLTPYYIDHLAHYLVLRDEINTYDEAKIVDAMKELSHGLLNSMNDLNRYNIEAVLTVLKGK